MWWRWRQPTPSLKLAVAASARYSSFRQCTASTMIRKARRRRGSPRKASLTVSTKRAASVDAPCNRPTAPPLAPTLEAAALAAPAAPVTLLIHDGRNGFIGVLLLLLLLVPSPVSAAAAEAVWMPSK